MPLSTTSKWLLSKNSSKTTRLCEMCEGNEIKKMKNFKRTAKTIAVSSGKGGVGKTSISTKLAKVLSQSGYKVLLIDCDYNMSNTYIKLGIPIQNKISQLINLDKGLDSCLHKDGNFHLLAGCNGNIELFNQDIKFEKFIIENLIEYEGNYDFIVFDTPAGISKDVLTINAYSDYRFIVVTPDKSSITDSYSLMKILNQVYGIKHNHLIINKITSTKQYKNIVKSLSETVENFLNSRLNILGGISRLVDNFETFDKIFLNDKKSFLHHDFLKVVANFTEEFDELLDSHSPARNSAEDGQNMRFI